MGRPANYLDELFREKRRNAALTIKLKALDEALVATLRTIPSAFAEGFIIGKNEPGLKAEAINEAWLSSETRKAMVKTFAPEDPNATIQ